MPAILSTNSAHDLITRAVTSLAGEEAVKRVSPSVKAAFELANQVTLAGSNGKRETAVTSVKVSIEDGSKGEDVQPVTTVYQQRQPVAAGPTKRQPIRVGGGSCFSITVGKLKVTVCVEWQS